MSLQQVQKILPKSSAMQVAKGPCLFNESIRIGSLRETPMGLIKKPGDLEKVLYQDLFIKSAKSADLNANEIKAINEEFFNGENYIPLFSKDVSKDVSQETLVQNLESALNKLRSVLKKEEF